MDSGSHGWPRQGQGEGRGENGTLRVLKCIFQVQIETG